MRNRLFGSFVLLALLFGAVVMSDRATAKEDKKEAAGTIEIEEGKDGKFRFRVKDGSDKILAHGQGNFATAKDAQAAAENLKKVVASAKVKILGGDK